MGKYDVYHSLKKLLSGSLKELNIDLTDPYSPLPDGLVTDGKGNVYMIPTSGSTPLVTINDNNYFKYRYNWSSNQIEIYAFDEDESNNEVDTYSYLDSIDLNPSDFIDNPEYWYQMAYEELKDFSDFDDFLVNEAIQKMDIFTDEDEYEYDYLLTAYMDIDNFKKDQWSDVVEDIEDKLYNYVRYPEYNGRKIEVKADLDTQLGNTNLNVKVLSPIELDKSDLDDVFSEVKTEVEDFTGKNVYYEIVVQNNYNVF